MELSEAKAILENEALTPCVKSSIPLAKELQSKLLAKDIPAILGGDDSCGGGCSPSAQIFVREEDVPKVAELMKQEWIAEAIREGTFDPSTMGASNTASDPDAEPPCPACGTAAPLVEGACTECGLQLA